VMTFGAHTLLLTGEALYPIKLLCLLIQNPTTLYDPGLTGNTVSCRQIQLD
jgi:hypothetical protein